MVVEKERGPHGLESTVTFFVTGAECPFSCAFCDLWQYTLDVATVPGAIAEQIQHGLDLLGGEEKTPHRAKLYNASNFFEKRAVPEKDLAEIARLLEDFEGVTVESHPLLLGDSCRDFSQYLKGRLEIALGLETSRPEALHAMGKGAALDDYRRAADFLEAAEVDLRIFLLIHPPWVPLEEQSQALVESVRFAEELGAQRISLIPLRRGNGTIEALEREGLAHPPSLEEVEKALAQVVEKALPRSILTVDLWDADQLTACPQCREIRLDRLRLFNRDGWLSPSVACGSISESLCAKAEVDRGW